MRLIDADELKKQFSNDEPYGPEEIGGIIDNAPTVAEDYDKLRNRPEKTTGRRNAETTRRVKTKVFTRLFYIISHR